MKRLFKSAFRNLPINQFLESNSISGYLNKTVKLTLALGLFTFVGCSTRTNDLTGVEGRNLWFHPVPYGTVYVPSGTYHSGQSDQDIFQTFVTPNKQVSIVAFWMDETEITNNEYRQFVNFVVDSIMRSKVDNDDLFIVNDEEDTRYIDYEQDFEPTPAQMQEELADMYYKKEDRFRGKKQLDVNILKYKYEWFDMVYAANDVDNRDKYQPGRVSNRGNKYIKREETLVYPDTLCWIRDFTYSYNDPMARHYFNHVKYDDYPVVGVNWHQAVAFCNWRTIYKNTYWEQLEEPLTEDFRLPTEFEWEYAARGTRNASMYPWGGPYTRNSKGCMLANFKPLRGNYGADGGIYTVRADSYFPNDYGLYNMAGNVAEWTINAWSESSNVFTHDLNPDYRISVPEYVKSKEGEYVGPENSPMTLKRKVIRGGSWKDVAYFIQNGARTYEFQDTAKSYIGFRCVQTYIGRSNKDRK
ncbi:MAG: SUMF1/EgtB/PvdO family nonheme iron enzyme [Bacteroidia bacterium]|nr:SUMF1/EgtB/PvdO family nonheme iron enzyme [Bacteroidia bacterium]